MGRSAGGIDAAIAGLSRTLGIEPADDRDRIAAEIFTGSSIAASEWPFFATALARGGKSDREHAARFGALSSLSGDERLDTYLDIFCTQGGTPRKSIVSHAVKDDSVGERLGAEQGRICALLERLRAVVCRDKSAALLTVTHRVLTEYRDDKERRGLTDYDDLIDKALALLRSVDAAWVHYKLDLGIDHVLIDEAQDTSTKQWEIISRLVAEFTAGAGARDVTRTIFAVGDEKQSIYSFQNAAPKEFAEMRRKFERAHQAAGMVFEFREFKHSFRSGESVLAAVEEVFKPPEIAISVTSDADGFPPHIALPDAAPSMVELWEPIGRTSGRRLKAGMRRSTASTKPARGSSWRGGSPRRCGRWSTNEKPSGSTAVPCATATCWCWCASAVRCSRRSFARSRTSRSRSRAPTGWFSPSTSR